jgi:hypothetical protein
VDWNRLPQLFCFGTPSSTCACGVQGIGKPIFMIIFMLIPSGHNPRRQNLKQIAPWHGIPVSAKTEFRRNHHTNTVPGTWHINIKI